MAISMEQHRHGVANLLAIRCLICGPDASIQDLAITQVALVLIDVQITVTIPQEENA
jgi:hypothetical protein